MVKGKAGGVGNFVFVWQMTMQGAKGAPVPRGTKFWKGLNQPKGWLWLKGVETV